MKDRIDPRRLLDSLGIKVEEDEGNELVARCPSGRHQDRNPSWTIHVGGDKNGLSHCRSCGFDVDAFGLVMAVIGVQFPTAKTWVEEHASSKEERGIVGSVRVETNLRSSRPVFKMPLGVEFGRPNNWPTPARDYLYGRGITDAQVERWGVGYAIEGRLAGRIVFPIGDKEGVLRSYVARTFSGQPVRYLTPRADENPDPSAVFGERWWKHKSVDGLVVVCEGAINALAVERDTGARVAALGGSRVDPRVASKLAKSFYAAVVLTDSDLAGDKAWAQLESMVCNHVRLVRIRLPEGMDPANAPKDMIGNLVNEAAASIW